MPGLRLYSRLLPHAVPIVFSALVVLPLVWLLRVALTDKVTAYKIPPEWGQMHLAATGQKSVPEAMAAAQEELRKLLVKDGKISE